MRSHADQAQEGRTQSAANESAQRYDGAAPVVHFDDRRPEAVAQRRVQEMANRRPQATQLEAVQDMANNTYSVSSDTAASPIQCMVNVYLETDEANKKSLVAKGDVEDFAGGTSAGNKGWVGVTKYRAWYHIESEEFEPSDGAVGPFKNSFTNPEAGHVLGKQNGGNGGDPENVFAQDGGTNNSKYKTFESNMRKDLNAYNDEDQVTFKSYLGGNAIKKGTIADEGLSDASSISSDEYSDPEGSSMSED